VWSKTTKSLFIPSEIGFLFWGLYCPPQALLMIFAGGIVDAMFGYRGR